MSSSSTCSTGGGGGGVDRETVVLVVDSATASGKSKAISADKTLLQPPLASSSPFVFRFVRGQDINATFFSSNSNSKNQNDDDSPAAVAHKQKPPTPPRPYLVTGQLVWVCKSKGLKKQTKKRRRGGPRGNSISSSSSDKGDKQQQPQQQRLEAFLRARIVHGDNANNVCGKQSKLQDEKEVDCCIEKAPPTNSSSGNGSSSNAFKKDEDEDEDRLLVRYPKGSTYMVKRNHLWPVLEPSTTIDSTSSIHGENDASSLTVLVFAETNFYRRACMVHTLPDGADIFWEIGCDAGSTIHKVASTLNSCNRNNNHDNNNDSASSLSSPGSSAAGRVLGIDKSQESIDEARRLYPHLPFCLWDVLAEEEEEEEKDHTDDKTRNSSNSCSHTDDDDKTAKKTAPFGSLSRLELAFQDALAAMSTANPTGTKASSSSTPSSLNEENTMLQPQTPTTTVLPCPTIVAIDINGNRELPAVLACVQKVSRLWKPRLILVKSRALHAQLSLSPQGEQQLDATLAAMMMKVKQSVAPAPSAPGQQQH
jgi:hypothetical protein